MLFFERRRGPLVISLLPYTCLLQQSISALDNEVAYLF